MEALGSTESSIGFFGVGIAVIALILDWRAQKRATAREKADAVNENLRYEHQLEIQRTERITTWANRCSHVLCKSDHFVAKNGTEFFDDPAKTRMQLGIEISTFIDQGRWLFRNWHPESYGETKHKLNHGFRDNRLDPLVIMYQKVMGDIAIDPNRQRKDFTLNIQKLAMPLIDQHSAGEN